MLPQSQSLSDSSSSNSGDEDEHISVQEIPRVQVSDSPRKESASKNMLKILILGFIIIFSVDSYFRQQEAKKAKSRIKDSSHIGSEPSNNNKDISQSSLMVTNSKGEQIQMSVPKPGLVILPVVREDEITPLDFSNQEDMTLALLQILKQDDGVVGKILHRSLNQRDYTQYSRADAQLLQYLFYNSKYDLDEPVQQKALCIVSPFRNFATIPHNQHFLSSLQMQNYSSYKLLMIDDSSSDNSIEYIRNTVKKYPRVNNRLMLLEGYQRVGALANKDYAIRNYCQNQAIVLQVDADDYLIGRQVLNIYSRIYSRKSEVWLMYSNYLFHPPGKPITSIKRGRNQDISDQIFATNTYRTAEKYWVTIHLRSYRRALYMKIPIQYFLGEDNKYYLWAADRFVMYALVQLAGREHTQYLDSYVYFYNQPDDAVRSSQGCTLALIRVNHAYARSQVPLLELGELDEGLEARKTIGYTIPEHVVRQSQVWKKQYEECLIKNGA